MDEFFCGICLKLVYNPCTILCGHTFCKSCIIKSSSTSKKCPSCSSLIPITFPFPTTFILTSFLEKHYPEAYSLRKHDQIIEFQFKQGLPIVFALNIISFPDCHITIPFSEPKYLEMLLEIQESTKKFCLLSYFNSNWIAMNIEITSTNSNIGLTKVLGICKDKLLVERLYRKGDFENFINIGDLGRVQVEDKVIWVAEENACKDIEEEKSEEVFTEMKGFFDNCVRVLSTSELADFDKIHRKSSKLSFQMLSSMKIPNDLLFKCFNCPSENQRLIYLQEYFANKKPSRLHLKVSKEAKAISKYSLIVILISILIIILSRTKE